MMEPIQNWIFNRIGEVLDINATTFGHVASDGTLIAKQLQSYDLIPSEIVNMITPSNRVSERLKNLNLLQTWLKFIGLQCDNDTIRKIAEADGATALNLFYEMFLILKDEYNVQRILHRVKPSKCHEESRFKVEPVFSTDVEHKPHDLSLELNKKRNVIDKYKEHYTGLIAKCKSVTKHSKDDLKRISPVQKKCKSSQVKKSSKECQYTEDKNDMETFDKKLSGDSRKLNYEELVALRNKVRAKSSTCLKNDCESKICISKIKEKVKDKSKSQMFQSRFTKTFISEVHQEMLNQDDINFNEKLSKILLKQSRYEKQIIMKLYQTRYQQGRIFENRIFMNEILSKRTDRQRENKFFRQDIISDAKEKMSNLEIKRNAELNKRLNEEKSRLASRENYTTCKDILESLRDVAENTAKLKSINNGELPPKNMWIDWNNLFKEGAQVSDIIHSVTEITEDEQDYNIENSVLGYHSRINKRELDDYLRLQGQWDLKELKVTDEFKEDLTIIGHVVHKLLRIRNPIPLFTPPIRIPIADITAVIIGLKDIRIINILKETLSKLSVSVILMEDVINFWLSKFGEESMGETLIIKQSASSDTSKNFGQPAKNKSVLYSSNNGEMHPSKHTSQKKSDDSIFNFENETINTFQRNYKNNDSFESLSTPRNINTRNSSIIKNKDSIGKKSFELTEVTHDAKEKDTGNENSKENCSVQEHIVRKNNLKILYEGKTIPDHMLVKMFSEYLKYLGPMKGWVLLNYPTTYSQMIALEGLLTGKVFSVSDRIKISSDLSVNKTDTINQVAIVSDFELQKTKNARVSHSSNVTISDNRKINPNPNGNLQKEAFIATVEKQSSRGNLGTKSQDIVHYSPNNGKNVEKSQKKVLQFNIQNDENDNMKHRLSKNHLGDEVNIENHESELLFSRLVPSNSKHIKQESLSRLTVYIEMLPTYEKKNKFSKSEIDKEVDSFYITQGIKYLFTYDKLNLQTIVKLINAIFISSNMGKQIISESDIVMHDNCVLKRKSKPAEIIKCVGTLTESSSEVFSDINKEERSEMSKCIAATDNKSTTLTLETSKTIMSSQSGSNNENNMIKKEIHDKNISTADHFTFGSQNWQYADFELPLQIEIALSVLWETIEKVYINSLEQIFFLLRTHRLSAIPYKINVMKNVRKFFERPDRRQIVLSKFQNKFNEIEEDVRKDIEMKYELHCQVEELQNEFQDMFMTKKKNAELEKEKIIKENWTAEELCMLVNIYVEAIQIETDMFIDTVQLLEDYYYTMLKRIPREQRYEKSLIPRLELRNDETPPAQTDYKSRRMRSSALTLQPIMNIKSALINYFLDVQVNKEINPVTLIHNFISDTIQTATEFVDKINHIASDKISFEDKEIFQNILLNKRKSKRKFELENGVESKLDVKDGRINVDTSSTDLKYVRRKWMLEEWQNAVKNEVNRVKFRFGVLKAKAVVDMEEITDDLNNTFSMLAKEIEDCYTKEIESSQLIAKVFATAIEEESRIQYEMVLEHEKFFIRPNVLLFLDTPPPLPPPPREEKVPDDEFSIKQLMKVYEKFNYLSPGGVMPERAFVHLLADIVVCGSDDGISKLLPVSWADLSPNDIPLLSQNIFGTSEFVCWKHFFIYALNLKTPTQKELLELKREFSNLDPKNKNIVSRDNFDKIKFWFEKNVTDNDTVYKTKLKKVRNFLFRMFQSSETETNYRDLLLIFCKDDDPKRGLAKALAVLLGKFVPVNTDDYFESLNLEETTSQEYNESKTAIRESEDSDNNGSNDNSSKTAAEDYNTTDKRFKREVVLSFEFVLEALTDTVPWHGNVPFFLPGNKTLKEGLEEVYEKSAQEEKLIIAPDIFCHQVITDLLSKVWTFKTLNLKSVVKDLISKRSK